MNDFFDYIFNLMDLETEPAKGMNTTELYQLNAKEVKPESIPAGAEWIGTTLEAYGDRIYYRTPDNEYIYTYYSIGD
jgi:hypothetical protein